jgi:hypothetical protein
MLFSPGPGTRDLPSCFECVLLLTLLALFPVRPPPLRTPPTPMCTPMPVLEGALAVRHRWVFSKPLYFFPSLKQLALSMLRALCWDPPWPLMRTHCVGRFHHHFDTAHWEDQSLGELSVSANKLEQIADIHELEQVRPGPRGQGGF